MDQIYLNEAPESSNLMDFVNRVWRWAWLIALAAILTGGAAYFFSVGTVPVYQTTTLLLVSNPPSQSSIDTTSMVSGAAMTQTYSQMLMNTPVLDKVIESLGLAITTENMAKAISVSVVQNTQIISVNVEDTIPSQAVDIANTLGQVFADRILQLQSERYRSTLQGLQKQVDDMDRQIDDTNAKLIEESDPARKLQLDSRLTEYRKLYSSLVTNYEQVRLAEAQTSTSVAVIQPAQLPTIPIRPKTTQNILLAAVVGMLAAMGAVFAVDFLDDTLKNPDEIRQRFNLPVIGVIARHPIIEGKTISQNQPRSPVTESFRALRTNITFSSVDRPLRRVLVTSATPQDGKTTVSANLAVVLAQGEKTVALVDGDMRRPQVHVRFGLGNQHGLTDLFINSLDEIGTYIQDCGVSRLSIITSGTLPPNPAELLTSKKMVQILDRLNQDHDLVIIDTPPVLSVTDAVALAPEMDGVILVAKPGTTKLAAFQQVVEQLRGVEARILGVVLNDVEPKSRKYGFYYNRYYSKYSNYYSTDGKKKKKSKKGDEMSSIALPKISTETKNQG